MLIDCYEPEDVFARVPELAEQTDPVLVQLDRLLDDDQLYGQVHHDLAHRYRLTSGPDRLVETGPRLRFAARRPTVSGALSRLSGPSKRTE